MILQIPGEYLGSIMRVLRFLALHVLKHPEDARKRLKQYDQGGGET